jgi:uncharacterized membrane protein YkvA (DUF1232 family)
VISRFIGSKLLSRLTKGKIQQPNKIQAILRLPTLLRLSIVLFRDNRVPLWLRGSVLGILALIFSPLDIVGDIPVVGQFWDFTLSVVVLEAFIQMAPSDVVNEHIKALGLEKKIPLREG